MRSITCYTMCALLAWGLSSCSRPGEDSFVQDKSRVLFQGLVQNDAGAVSRSNALEEDGFVLINSSSSVRFGQISICRKVEGQEDITVEYKATDAMQGHLSPYDPDKALTWNKRDESHTFYAWTHPSVNVGGNTTGGVVMDSNQSKHTGTVTFGTKQETNLEEFIVARTSPLTYDDNGSYVSLRFYRPIAKIQLDTLRYMDGSGSLSPVEKCTIHFPNIYSQAAFDALAPDAIKGEGWLQPVEGSQGITWEWDVSDTGVDPSDHVLYVAPFQFGSDGADGSMPDEQQPGFFSITAQIGGEQKTYYATLAGMVDLTELKAGEYMKMQILMRDGASGGVGCQIVKWNTEPDVSIPHRREGIYSQEDAEALLALLQQKPVPTDELDRYCAQGKTIYLYTHIDWSDLKDELTLPDGYHLDGQDHYVTFGDGGSLTGNISNLYTPDGKAYPNQNQ